MKKCTIYRSYCSWPIQAHRLCGGWLIRFFGYTIIVDNSARFTPPPEERPNE